MLIDTPVSVRLKLSALWAATTFCYVYGDVFGFFREQTIRDIASGRTGIFGTQYGLLAAAVSVAISSLLVVLTLLLPPAVARWMNGILGVAYTIIMLLTMPGAWFYYIFLGVVECILTLLIVWQAWSWPKQVPIP